LGLELDQHSKYLGDDYWHWSVWVEGTDEELDGVDHVVYTLHPTFPNPVRTVRERSTKFRLESEGWGVFRLFATVVYSDRTQRVLEIDLKFDYPPEAQWPVAVRSEPATEGLATTLDLPEPRWADGIFEGSGMKAITFAGALQAAADVAGIEKWVNVAGTSAGSIVATLLAAGYKADDIRVILREANYRSFARFGLMEGAINVLFGRGLSHRKYIRDWLSHLLANSPIGDSDPPFAAFAHPERSGDLSPNRKFSLRIIASDISASRMVVLPDEIDGYQDSEGHPLSAEDFKVLDAVKMSISTPFLYMPSVLYRNARPHYIVDGSLLSMFPISMFDDPVPLRPTWGFRLHNIGGDEELRYPRISGPFAMLRLGQAVVTSVMDAWDKQRVPSETIARTVIIPTSGFREPGYSFSKAQLDELYNVGYQAAREFFGPVRSYVNSLGAELAEAPTAAPSLE
jgi:NTE family protein